MAEMEAENITLKLQLEMVSKHTPSLLSTTPSELLDEVQ